MCDARVKKKIMSVLRSWHAQFGDDPSMKLIAGLYASCGGGQKVSDLFICFPEREFMLIGILAHPPSQSETRSAAHAAFDDQQARYDQEADERAMRKALERSQKEAERERLAREKEERKKAKNQPPRKVKRAPFDFEAVSLCFPYSWNLNSSRT